MNESQIEKREREEEEEKNLYDAAPEGKRNGPF